MKPDKTQMEQIQTFLTKRDSAVTFYPKGKEEHDGYWYLTQDSVSECGEWDPKTEDYGFYEDRTLDDFVKFAQGVPDLVAKVNLEGPRSFEETFEDWEHLARYMGLTDLVVMSTKVPRRIAEKFTYYVTQDTTVSNQLRRMIFDFVVDCIKENAAKDALR